MTWSKKICRTFFKFWTLSLPNVRNFKRYSQK
jgi:hypothetical protein